MVTLKESFRNEIRKVIAGVLRIETCEVLDVQLHMQPEDQKMNTVTIRLRDASALTDCQEIIRYRVPVLCSYVGHKFGFTWNPKVGDLVQVLFLSNEKAYVISPYYNQEQRTICRQNPDDVVLKLCQTPAAEYESDAKCQSLLMSKYIAEGMNPADALAKAQRNAKKYLKKFENPQHPVCTKFFGKDRSFILISDCPLGHTHPDCELCKDLEDIEDHSNSIKMYPSQHPQHPNRVRYSHKKGQHIQFEDDGSILLEDSRGNFICLQGNANEGGIVLKDKAGSFIALNGNGTVTVHAAQNGSHNLHTDNCACGGGHCTMINPNPYGFDDMNKTVKQED